MAQPKKQNMEDLKTTEDQPQVGSDALLAALKPVIDWYQSDEQPPRNPIDIIRDIVEDLQSDRADCLRLRRAMESIRDTSVAMMDSLRITPKTLTVILVEGPRRVRDKACDAIAPANAEAVATASTKL